MTDWNAGYIAVDWGTTNRRAWRVEQDRVSGSLEDELGLKAMSPADFPEAVKRIRQSLGDLPMLLGGMVGSNRGWHEAPYVDCPAGAEELAHQILWIDGVTGIVPGVAQRPPARPDIMRGEEIQLIGALETGQISPDALICHPGTHTKWIGVKCSRIAHFQTMMTGEIFALLASDSILAAMMKTPVTASAEFDAGVDDALAGEPMLSALFRIRARALLVEETNDSASRASGVLIGSEVKAALREFEGGPVGLIGRPDLSELYARVLTRLGREYLIVDGSAAFRSGIAALTRILK